MNHHAEGGYEAPGAISGRQYGSAGVLNEAMVKPTPRVPMSEILLETSVRLESVADGLQGLMNRLFGEPSGPNRGQGTGPMNPPSVEQSVRRVREQVEFANALLDQIHHRL